MIDATDPGLRAPSPPVSEPCFRLRLPLGRGFDASTLTMVSERLGELLADDGQGHVAGWEIGSGVGVVRVHGRPERVRALLGRALLECGVARADHDEMLHALADPALWG